MVLSCTAFEYFTIYRTFEVDNNCIAVLSWSVNCNLSCVLFLNFLQFSFDFFVCYFYLILRYFNTLVLAKCNFWFSSNFCCKDEIFAFFHLCNIDGWLRCDLDILYFCKCLVIFFRNNDVGSIFIEHACTVHLLYHCLRHFTFSETWNGDLVLHLLVSLCNRLIESFSWNCNCQFRHIMF